MGLQDGTGLLRVGVDTAPDKIIRVRLGLTLIIYSGIRLCTATGAVSLITASTALITALIRPILLQI